MTNDRRERGSGNEVGTERYATTYRWRYAMFPLPLVLTPQMLVWGEPPGALAGTGLASP